MAKASSSKAVSLVGGTNAHLVNPLKLTYQYRAVCVSEGTVLSPKWRDTKDEAIEDARDHIAQGHYIDFNVRIG